MFKSSNEKIEFGKDIFIVFIDLEKAFNNALWKELLQILRQIGIDCRDK